MRDDRLNKVKALYRGATTPGERAAAEAAIMRILQSMVEQSHVGAAPETPKKRKYVYELAPSGGHLNWQWKWKETSSLHRPWAA